ncbi:MAG: FKBP-type peptidyl-prolyl cis-trans isomerase [Pseudoxanthomonas suwonensis]|nr:FKBP-type peptidyl-prolyl cis-trans isomerase [Pseudoxanthomonas suwonensis]
MRISLRKTALAMAAASAVLLAAGCNKPAGDAVAAAGKSTTLSTEKDKISYTIGMDMAKSLEPAKDEVDVDVLAKAIKDVWAGREAALTEEQANEIRETFTQKMQAQQITEMLAKGRRNAEEGARFLEENGKKEGVTTTASGLQYQVLEQGSGARPGKQSVVKVHYKGELLDGTVFDDSSERSEPATIPLAQVVPGWAEGIQLMTPGSKYRFWIPASLGYGEQGTPGGPIPPNATLVFDVELLEIVQR